MATPQVAATPLRRDIVSLSHLTVRGQARVRFGSVRSHDVGAWTCDYSRFARVSWWMRDDELVCGCDELCACFGVVLFLSSYDYEYGCLNL
jgi:hypothetical protein